MTYSYISQFFEGVLDPTWPHIVLIAGSIVGGALVGLGVILEAPKIFSLPVAAVFIGVVIEAACTLLLFGFDEGISGRQQSEIISSQIEAKEASIRALRAELALVKVLTPRNLSDAAQKQIVAKLKPLGPQPFTFAVTLAIEEGSDLPKQLGALLIWEMYGVPQGAARYKGTTGIGVTLEAGVVVSYDGNDGVLKNAATVLAEALGDEGIASRAEAEGEQNSDDKKVMKIAIGTKPLFLREIIMDLNLEK